MLRLKQIKLSRITDGKKIIPEIEGLRFVSILLVVISHINNNLLRIYPVKDQNLNDHPLSVFLEQCGAGVHIFFFISGFILSVPFLEAFVYKQKKISLKRYYYRRLTRIEPPYIISLIFFFIATLIFLQQPFAAEFEHFTISAFYLHNIIYGHISTVNPVAWSLEIEIQFYIVFPLLAYILFLKKDVWRRMMLLIAFALASIFYRTDMNLLACLRIFIAGMIAAEIYLARKDFFLTKKNISYDIAGVLALYAIITLSGYQNLLYKLFLLACYIVLFTAAFKGKWLNKIFTNKNIMIIGGMCYSAYLMHYAVIYFNINYFTKYLFTQNYPLDILIQTTILLPFIIFLSVVFFILIERPFMDIEWPVKLKNFLSKLSLFKKDESSSGFSSPGHKEDSA